MGFRFRRSVKLLPGVRLNFSTRGVSTSLGGRGATLNLSRRGARATVGLPGTGLSYSTLLSGPSPAPAQDRPARPGSPLIGWLVLGGILLALAMCVSGRSATPIVRAGPAIAPAQPVRTIIGDAVNCRATADKTGAVLARLGKGEALAVLDQKSGWTRLVHPGGDCWVSNTLLTN